MLIEMHCHTAEHSPCSAVPAVELVRQIFARGLQGVVLTDHHYLWPAEELTELRRRAEVPDYFLIMAGQELCAAGWGDVLVYGATEVLPRGTSLEEVRCRFPEAALVWAHPYRGGSPPDDDRLVSTLLDGVEIFNSNHTARGNSRGLRDWHRLRFAAIAGTDTHAAAYAGTYPTIFDHPLSTIAELSLEIRKGRCRPFFKEIPHAGANSLITEVTIGTKGADERRERIVIRTIDNDHKWRSAERGFRIMAAIAERGFSEGPYRVPHAIDEDAAEHTLIEQGLRGRSLFDKLLSATSEDGREYLQLTGRWLASLHRLRLRVTAPEEFLPRERKRLANYLGRFEEIGHRHSRKVREIMEMVQEGEEHLTARLAETFVQGHGDFHPKNVMIGQDSMERRDTLFVAAIDFESSLVMPPAFDVGCFLAQYRNQLFGQPAILAAVPEELFWAAYLEEAGDQPPDFPRQVELFRARTNLSIAAFLVKLGLGESDDLWRVLVEAERALVCLSL